MSELPAVPDVVPGVIPAAVPAAVVDGGADDIELVAALSAVAAVTGAGEVGRRLAGRGPVAPAVGAPADPWTASARSAATDAGTSSGDRRRTHRWSRMTSHRT